MIQPQGVWKTKRERFLKKENAFYGKGDDKRRVRSNARSQRIALRILSNNDTSDANRMFPLGLEPSPKHLDTEDHSILTTPQVPQLNSHWGGLARRCVHRESWGAQPDKRFGALERGSFQRDLFILLDIFIKTVWNSHSAGRRGRAGGRKRLVLWPQVALPFLRLLWGGWGKARACRACLGVRWIRRKWFQMKPSRSQEAASPGGRWPSWFLPQVAVFYCKDRLYTSILNIFWVATLPRPKGEGERGSRGVIKQQQQPWCFGLFSRRDSRKWFPCFTGFFFTFTSTKESSFPKGSEAEWSATSLLKTVLFKGDNIVWKN